MSNNLQKDFMDSLHVGSRVSTTCVDYHNELPVWVGEVVQVSPKRQRFLVQWQTGKRTEHDGGGSFMRFSPKRPDTRAFDCRFGGLQAWTEERQKLSERSGVVGAFFEALDRFKRASRIPTGEIYRLTQEIDFFVKRFG